MNRRELLGALSASIALPVLARIPADQVFATGRRVHARARGGPFQILDPHQSETVATIADMIIPATDTPGARAAGVHRFIDLLLAESFPDDERASFLAGLADLDARARAAFGGDFLAATEPQRVQLLEKLDAEGDPKTSFFRRLKGLVVYGYFTSEAGAKEELHFTAIPGSFNGCAPLSDASAVPGDF